MRLSRAGIAADLYEARPSLGGRILSDHTTFAGQHCDRARAIGEGKTSDQASAFLGQFGQVFSGIKNHATGRAVRMAWHQQPLTLGSYSSYLVGQYTQIAGSEGTVVGGLHFCGEHTCHEYQGFMEGGARSGERVASEIASALNAETTIGANHSITIA